MSRLKEKYDAEIKSAMVEKFGYKNVMQIPKLDKIVINMGVGEACLLYTSPSPRDCS